MYWKTQREKDKKEINEKEKYILTSLDLSLSWLRSRHTQYLYTPSTVVVIAPCHHRSQQHRSSVTTLAATHKSRSE